MSRLCAAFFVAALVAAFSLPVAAAPLCGDHDWLANLLKEKYGEQPVGRGLSHKDVMLEVYASPGGATWTLVVTRPGLMSCAADAGENWRTLEPEEPRT